MLLMLNILLNYLAYFSGSVVCMLFINIVRSIRCTGSIYVDGCNKKIYSYNFYDIIKIAAYRQFIVVLYFIFFRNKKRNEILNLMKPQYIETYKIKYLNLPYDIKIPARREKSFCCKKCWEEHEIIQVAETLISNECEDYLL